MPQPGSNPGLYAELRQLVLDASVVLVTCLHTPRDVLFLILRKADVFFNFLVGLLIIIIYSYHENRVQKMCRDMFNPVLRILAYI